MSPLAVKAHERIVADAGPPERLLHFVSAGLKQKQHDAAFVDRDDPKFVGAAPFDGRRA
jgi:hypothetical protein